MFTTLDLFKSKEKKNSNIFNHTLQYDVMVLR